MKILYRYILKEQIGPLLSGIAIIIAVFMLDFLLEILDLIFSKGAGVAPVLKLFFYNFAWMFALAVPMGVLVASLVSFGRLSQDGEIVAIRNAGIPIYRIMVPPLILYIVLFLFMIYFSANILPDFNYKAKTLMVSISKKRPTLSIKERYFNEVTSDYTLFAKRVNYKENRLYGVIIYNKSAGRFPQIVIADSGDMKYDERSDALFLKLYAGEIHEVKDEDPAQFKRALFRVQRIKIPNIGSKFEEVSYIQKGDREMNLASLRAEAEKREKLIKENEQKIVELSHEGVNQVFMPTNYTNLKKNVRTILLQIKAQREEIKSLTRQKYSYLVEVQKKFSIPFACVVFALLGAPVGILARRGGYLTALAISLLFFILYWAFLIGGEELADRGKANPVLAMWFPNIVVGTIALYFNYHLMYERTPIRWIDYITRLRFFKRLYAKGEQCE